MKENTSKNYYYLHARMHAHRHTHTQTTLILVPNKRKELNRKKLQERVWVQYRVWSCIKPLEKAIRAAFSSYGDQCTLVLSLCTQKFPLMCWLVFCELDVGSGEFNKGFF